MKTDPVDEKILEILKEDSRTSNVRIAKSLGISEGAVRSRIRKLSDRGIIKRFTVELSSGAGIFALMMLKARGETKRMMAQASSLGLHKDAYEISGEFDGCLVIEGASMEDLDSKVDRIRKLKEVSDTRTFVSFRRW